MTVLDELLDAARAPAASDVPDAIVLDGLSKAYPDGTQAVRGISLRVAHGEAFGLLGPNGAGKSTTLGMLGTLIRPTSGSARVAGFDVSTRRRAVLGRVGFAMQQAGIDPFATPLELLVLHGRLHDLRKAEARRRARLLLRLVRLDDVAEKRIATLSGGMQRRVDLAAALMHLPSIVFLDEPTEGLDPQSRAALWDTLDELRRRLGTTLMLTTHYMEEADRLCDRIGIVARGRLVAEGSPQQLKASVGSASATLEDAYLQLTGHTLAGGAGNAIDRLGRAA